MDYLHATEEDESPHESLFFIKGNKMYGVRSRDNFKYFDRHPTENAAYSTLKQGPFLFDLNHDQMESYNVSAHFPEKEIALRDLLESKREQMKSNPRGWRVR
jgi:hypothetical protein